jgi:diguanylate cyclase (GGDEF)-like protein/PAS domain S-box-containing protein
MKVDEEILRSLRKRQLRVLCVEDDPAHFELCLRELRKAKLDIQADIVQSENEFVEKLSADSYDIVLSDYRLDSWTGVDAFELLKKRSARIPFILVTGVLDDDVAVDCIKRGVSDYVPKDHLARLPVAICRALHQQYLAEARNLIYGQLQESEQKFRTLAETIASGIFVFVGAHCQYANRAAEIITGYSKDELLSMTAWEFFRPEFCELVVQMGLDRARGDVSAHRCEAEIATKSGASRWLDLTMSSIETAGLHGELITALDITARKSAEDDIRQSIVSDPLTGLANYGRLHSAFDSETERSRRTGRSFALLLMDLDGLRKINDSYGHLVGSRALCRLGNILRVRCRTVDIAARYGGDQFAILLPETRAEGAEHLAQRIAETVQNDGELPALSVSFGSSVYPTNGKTFTDMLRAAGGGLNLMKSLQHVQASGSPCGAS